MSDVKPEADAYQLEQRIIEVTKKSYQAFLDIDKELMEKTDEMMHLHDKLATLWLAVGLLFLVNCVLAIVIFLRFSDGRV